MNRPAAAVALGALALGTACSGQPAATVVDEQTALTAMADSLAGSWTWSGRLDVELSEAQVDAVVAFGAGDAFGADDDAVERQVRLALAELARQRMHGAFGDDASWRTAWQRDDVDLVDVRLDVGEVVRAESMTPDAGVVGAVDVAGIAAFIRDTREVDDSFGWFEVPTADQLRDEARRSFAGDPDLLEVVLAIIDGRFGGVVGQLDFADLGVTEDQLDLVREGFGEEFAGLADTDAVVAMADDALTVRDVTTDGGVTRAVVDLHPRAAAHAIDDLFDDARFVAEDLGDSYVVDEDLPETLTEVAQLTFDADGHLTEVRTDVLGVAGQLAAVMDLDVDAARLLSQLQGATVHVVFGFGDHGAVATVTDVEATTMPWDGIVEFFRPDVEDVLEGTG